MEDRLCGPARRVIWRFSGSVWRLQVDTYKEIISIFSAAAEYAGVGYREEFMKEILQLMYEYDGDVKLQSDRLELVNVMMSRSAVLCAAVHDATAALLTDMFIKMRTSRPQVHHVENSYYLITLLHSSAQHGVAEDKTDAVIEKGLLLDSNTATMLLCFMHR